MKVLANRYLYRFREFLPESVEMDLFDPDNFPQNAYEYDALFINTTTPVNRETLPKRGNLSFIATGSSGTDHLDFQHLNELGIETANAAGCNAKTVAEYVLTCICIFHETSGIPFDEYHVGIVGIGHVGTEVSRLLNRFTIPHISYDPPKSDRVQSYTSAHFEEMKECNILTFHTPLTKAGHYPTRHLLNRSWFRGTDYNLLINSARGGIIDEKLVLEELETGRLNYAVIDVWENEPLFRSEVARHAMIATPHIAGYSAQSKRRATQMIIDQFCRYFEIETPAQKKEEKHYPVLKGQYSTLGEILLDLNPVGWYDKKLRELISLPDDQKAAGFTKLRSESPLRHEYSNLYIDPDYLESFPELSLLDVKPVE